MSSKIKVTVLKCQKKKSYLCCLPKKIKQLCLSHLSLTEVVLHVETHAHNDMTYYADMIKPIKNSIQCNCPKMNTKTFLWSIQP